MNKNIIVKGAKENNLKDIDLDKETFSSDGIHYKSPYEGMYSMYNCAVVLNVAKNYGISQDCVKSVFSHAPQPAGRNETFISKEQICILNLVKNPTGANEVMKVIFSIVSCCCIICFIC